MKRSLVMLLVGIGVVAAVAVSLGFYWPFSRNHNVLVLPGTVEVHELRLGSKVGGRVKEVVIREGDVVDAGKPLLEFDAPELRAQRDQLAAKLASAQADYEKAENGPRPQERAEARKAMDAAEARKKRMEKGWRDEEKEQAEKDWEAAKADYEYAKENWERTKAAKEISSLELESAHSRYKATLGRYGSAKAKWEMLKTGSRPEDIADVRAQYEQAKAHYDLLEAGTREEDKRIARAQLADMTARLRELDANLAETVVTAPSKIFVEVLSVRKGDLVPANQPVIRALLADERWVKVFAPQNELGKMHVGDAVEVTCDTFPGKTFKGTIIQIATASEFTPRNVQSADERRHQVFAVKVRVDDDEGRVFKSGMAAEVRVPLGGK
jgi:multidrug resistance efflux pump